MLHSSFLTVSKLMFASTYSSSFYSMFQALQDLRTSAPLRFSGWLFKAFSTSDFNLCTAPNIFVKNKIFHFGLKISDVGENSEILIRNCSKYTESDVKRMFAKFRNFSYIRDLKKFCKTHTKLNCKNRCRYSRKRDNVY